jgi:hypothetical protein
MGRIKCNIDAPFPSNSNRNGIGNYIHNETSVSICAKIKWVEVRCEVHGGEALGFLFASWWVHELTSDWIWTKLQIDGW